MTSLLFYLFLINRLGCDFKGIFDLVVTVRMTVYSHFKGPFHRRGYQLYFGLNTLKIIVPCFFLFFIRTRYFHFYAI